MFVRQCKICKKLKLIAEFESKLNPNTCNICDLTQIPAKEFRQRNPNLKPKREYRTLLSKARERDKSVRDKIIEFFNFYDQFPHVDFTQRESLVLYTQIMQRSIKFKFINYQNKRYETYFTTESIREVLDVIGPQVWRYVNYKQCLGCRQYLPTYEGADKPEVVFECLTKPGFRPKPINFIRKPKKDDRMNNYCNNCLDTQKQRDKRLPPWIRNPKPKIQTNSIE